MEKNPNKSELDNKDDVDEEVDEKTSSNNSKKTVIKKSDLSLKKARFFKAEKTEEQGEKPTQSNETTPNEAQENLESQNDEEIDELTEEEVHEAVLAIVDTRMQDVSEELNVTENDSAEEFVAMSSAIFLETLAERATTDEDFTQSDIEDAFNETLEDISLDEPNEDLTTEELGETEEVLEVGLEISLNEPQELPDTPTSSQVDSGADSVEPVILSARVPSLPVSVVGTTETIDSPRPAEVPDVYEAYIPRSDMLLGVVVGYIIGRRGGRKRAEKEFKPQVKKLEKQVSELTEIVSKKEVLIRKQALKIYEQSFDKSDKTEIVIERRRIRSQVKEQLARREALIKNPGVEKIGKFSLPALNVFHERRLPDGNENSPKRIQVEVMTVAQLLEKIEGLKINNLSVKAMYENNRLSVDILRQITKEYLRGGEYIKTFNRELLPDPNEIESYRSKVEERHQVMKKPQNDGASNINSDIKQSNSSTEKDENKIVNNDSSAQNNVPSNLVITAIVLIVLLLIALFVLIFR